MSEKIVHENSIEILDYKLKGELPNPFIFNDGTLLTDPKDWPKRRKEIYETAINLQYGTIPPAPEFLDVETMYLSGGLCSYRITTGTRANPVVFIMYIFKTKAKGPAPVVISGDMCFPYAFDKEYTSTFTDNGINFVTFNRTELAPDIANYNICDLNKESGEYIEGKKILDGVRTKNCGGQLKKAYPEYTFGALGAWAWGYSRCVDALEKLGNFDMSMVVFTGHSRGGKTAALAGAIDERATIVNPNASCSGGYGSYRIHIKAKTEWGEIKESEPLSNIYHHFPAWLGSDMEQYVDNEEKLPFDSHYLKALVAPRVLFVSEAASDIMANPVGTYQTTEAANEVYKFLGCEENLIWHYRYGGHAQLVKDISQLVAVIKHVQNGEPLNDKFFIRPFKEIPPAYSWKCPKK